jgi:hypothetical protein
MIRGRRGRGGSNPHFPTLHPHTPIPCRPGSGTSGIVLPTRTVAMCICKKDTSNSASQLCSFTLMPSPASTTMSTTTTQTQTRTRQTVLRDYELHHSPSTARATGNSEAAPAPRPQATPVNPPNWDTTHRRVPPYRPINRDRDQSEVRIYTSPIEQVFVGTMFTGVLIHAVSLFVGCNGEGIMLLTT